MNTFEILLEKYGKTVEDVTFDIEGLSDEELEAKFKEAFEDSDGDNGTDDGTDDNSGEPAKFTKTFTVELSHDDIRNALYVLVRQYETEDEYYYIREVFDSYFIMQDWYNNKIYKQSYAVDGEDVSFDGDRVEVFEILVTKEEKDALDALKENYSALEVKYNELKAFKDKYDAAELKAQKDAVFAREEYSVLADDEAFKVLVSEADKFSVEELASKAKAIFADHVISTGAFSAKTDEANKPKALGLNFNKKETKKSPYGNLFAKD